MQTQGALIRKRLQAARGGKRVKETEETVADEFVPREASWLDALVKPRPLAVLCFVVSLALYANTLNHQLTYDDVAAVKMNPYVQGDRPWLQLLSFDFWGTPTSSSLSHKSYRPMTMLVYRIIWAVSNQSVWAMHAFQIIANAVVAAMAVLWVLEPVCESSISKLVAALLFTVHPIKTEAVNGVVGLAEILSAGWAFYAFHLYVQKGLVVAAGVACFAASICKETGVTAALVIAAYDFAIQKRGVKKSFLSQWWKRSAVILIAFSLWVGIRLLAFGTSWTVEPSWQDNPILAHSGFLWLVNTAVVQTKYLELLFWPRNLSCDYSFNALPLVSSLADLAVLRAAGAVVLVALVAWWAWKSGREAMVALSWYVAPMLPATHLFGIIGTLVAERLLYIPLLGWGMLLGIGSSRLMTKSKRSTIVSILILVILLLSCGILSAGTVTRNKDWTNNTRLFNRTLTASPNSLKALMNMAGVRFEARDDKGVMEFLERAAVVDPQYCQAYQLMGRTRLEISHNFSEGLNLLTTCYQCMIKKRHSSQLLAEVLEMIGKCHMELKDPRESLKWFKMSIESGSLDAACNQAVAHIRLDEYDRALQPSEACLKEGLQNYRLGNEFNRKNAGHKIANHVFILHHLKRWKESVSWLQRALQLNPSDAERLNRLMKTAEENL